MDYSGINIEYDKNIEEVVRGRKGRSKDNKGRQRKTNRYDENRKEIMLTCSHTSNPEKKQKVCEARKLTYEDAQLFRHHFYSGSSKVEQDKFLMQYIKFCYPKRKKKTNIKKGKAVTIYYSIRTKSAKVVPVCATLFKNVTGISTHRIVLMCKYSLHTGEVHEERRGGSRATSKDLEITESIKAYIKKYKCRESHLSRGKVLRHYLPPELTISKMYKDFCKERDKIKKAKCSLSKFKHIFYTCFNIGFGNPHSDTCSTCKIYQIAIKDKTKSDAERSEQERLYKLHTKTAKEFHKIMKKNDPEVIKIVFDMQQNQPLPKLSVGEIFYSRQVWLFNLTIMIHKDDQKRKNIHHYTWLETESGRGANQVASCLVHFLRKLARNALKNATKKYTVHLFSDSCASQNKNTIIMASIMNFLKNCKAFKTIKHFFPIRGHSFMPADRVFGRVEKEYRVREEIVTPKEYRDILNDSGKVFSYGKNYTFYDYQSKTKNIIKKKLPFKISEARVIKYSKKNNNLITVSSTTSFSENFTDYEVIRANTSISTLDDVDEMPKINKVSMAKSEDVKKLLKYFIVPDDAQVFYEDVLNATSAGDGNEDDNNIKIFDEE